MAIRSWTLLGADQSSAETLSVDSRVAGGDGPGWRVERRTLHAGLSQGVDVVEIETQRLRLIVVPTRGMGLWRAWFDGFELGWQSPVHGPVHPSFVPLSDPSGLGWLDGFDELACRCGLENLGAPEHDERGQLRFALHGRIANRPARQVELVVDDEAGTISLHGIVEESRYHFQKLRLHTTYTVRLDATEIRWHDEVENFGGTAARLQMLYHINIGRPHLAAGAKLVAPIKELRPGSRSSTGDAARNWANYDGPTPGYQEQVFQTTLLSDDGGDSLVLLEDPSGQRAVKLEFNVNQLPHFTLWKNSVAEADGYVTGLEPGTCYPNQRSAEEAAGRVMTLQPGERWQAAVSLDVLTDQAAIQTSEQTIAALQASCEPTMHLEMA
ncbi:MAG: aldose 1-epimerase family protein [Planctomycetales bacterium]|nr:aldose 1-epimerase family protein [Planctomycetales bacterium]